MADAKLTKWDKKYGDKTLKKWAKEGGMEEAYENYVKIGHDIATKRIIMITLSVFLTACMVVSIFLPSFIFIGWMLIIFVLHGTNDLRIDTLWRARFIDEILEGRKLYLLRSAYGKSNS